MLSAFFKRYRVIFLPLPLIYIAGNIHPALGMLFFLFPVLTLLKRGDHQAFLILFLVVTILGDSRELSLVFFKPLRIFALLGMVLLSFSDLSKKKYSIRPIFSLAVIFFFIGIIALTRNLFFSISLQKTISYFFILFLFIHQWNYVVRKKGKTLFRDIIILCSIVYSLGILLYMIGSPIVMFSPRYRGLFGNPNGLGVHCTLAFIVFFFYFRVFPKVFSPSQRWIIWSLLLASIALSTSRNALASVGLFLVFYFFFKGGPFKKFFFITCMIPVFYMVFSYEFITSVIMGLGLGEELRIETLLSGSGRFFAWQYAMDVFQQTPWIGKGFFHDEYIFSRRIAPIWLINSGHQGGVHNSFISFLLNTGVIGLSVYLLLIIRILSKIPNSGIAVAIFVGTSFCAFFEPWMVSSLNAFTSLYFLGILLAINHTKTLVNL